MKIKWNKVTWYSKLAAIIFFIGVLPATTFYLGMAYQEATMTEVHKTGLDATDVAAAKHAHDTMDMQAMPGTKKK